MTRAQAIAEARRRLSSLDGSWASASDQDIVNHILSDPTVFVGNDPVRVAITGGSSGGGVPISSGGTQMGGTPNFDFLPKDIPTTDMLSFWNSMYEIDRQFYEDVRQFGLGFAEQQRQFNMQQAVSEAEITGVFGGQPTMDARKFLMEARNNPDILGSIYASQGLPYNMNMQAEQGIPGYQAPYYGQQFPDSGSQQLMWPDASRGQSQPGTVSAQVLTPVNMSDPAEVARYNQMYGGYDSGSNMSNPYAGAPNPTYAGGYPTGGQAPGQDELDYRGNYEDWLNWFMQTRSGGQQGVSPPYSGGGGGTSSSGGGVSLDQARSELVAAAGGAGWAEGTYGGGTPGYFNEWETAPEQKVAEEYYKQSGRLVSGYNPTEASRILSDFRQRLIKTGKPEFIQLAVSGNDQQLAQHLLGDSTLFVGDPGKEALQAAMGGGFGLTYGAQQPTTTGTTPTSGTSPDYGQYWMGGTDESTSDPNWNQWNDPRYDQLIGSPFVQALGYMAYGSPNGQGYGSDPNVAVPGVNEIPFNWWSGLSSDEQEVVRGFYPGLTDEAFQEPFQTAIESMGGQPPSIGYRA